LDSSIYLQELKKQLGEASGKKALYQAIVDAPFYNKAMTAQMGLGILVLLLVNKEQGTIDRIALARTALAQGAVAVSVKPFNEIKIPYNDPKNFIAIAVRRQHHMITSDWQYLFVPALSDQEARMNQAGAGIACSVVYPLKDVGDGGAMIFSYYEPVERIGKIHHKFMTDYIQAASSALRKLN
jgi:hypothetical protein